MELNKIYQGNSYDLIKQLDDNSIDLIVTNPPYVVQTTGGIYTQKDKRYVKELKPISNGFDISILDEMCRVMKKINCYIWCSQKQLIPLLDYFVKEKKCNWNLITWHKSNPIPACGNKYVSDTEYCLFFREKGVKVYGNYRTKLTFYTTPLNTKDKKKYNHPTIKPQEIVENLIVNSSNENDIVFDPFSGSGTTLVAAKKLNRQYIGFELEQKYVDTTNERLNELDINN